MHSINMISSVPRDLEEKFIEDASFALFFHHLFVTQLFTDVDFYLKDSHLSAHKMVLSLWSPVFADLFFNTECNKIGNRSNILQYNDVNAEAFEIMLRFMYGNGMIAAFESHKEAFDVYKVSAKFQVNSLKQACAKFINEVEIEPSNVFEILEVSEYMGDKDRIDACIYLMQERTNEVMAALDPSEVSSRMLHVILDLRKVSLPDEYELVKWVFKWGKNKHENCLKSKSTREILEPFLPKMNILKLRNDQFAELCLEHEDFFTKDEIISIFMNIGIFGSRGFPEWYYKNFRRAYNSTVPECICF